MMVAAKSKTRTSLIERIAWLGIVLLWFWPLTLGVLSLAVLIYIAIVAIRLIAVAPVI